MDGQNNDGGAHGGVGGGKSVRLLTPEGARKYGLPKSYVGTPYPHNVSLEELQDGINDAAATPIQTHTHGCLPRSFRNPMYNTPMSSSEDPNSTSKKTDFVSPSPYQSLSFNNQFQQSTPLSTPGFSFGMNEQALQNSTPKFQQFPPNSTQKLEDSSIQKNPFAIVTASPHPQGLFKFDKNCVLTTHQATPKQRKELGVDIIVTEARRSPRLQNKQQNNNNNNNNFNNNNFSKIDLTGQSYAYSPNKFLQKKYAEKNFQNFTENQYIQTDKNQSGQKNLQNSAENQYMQTEKNQYADKNFFNFAENQYLQTEKNQFAEKNLQNFAENQYIQTNENQYAEKNSQNFVENNVGGYQQQENSENVQFGTMQDDCQNVPPFQQFFQFQDQFFSPGVGITQFQKPEQQNNAHNAFIQNVGNAQNAHVQNVSNNTVHQENVQCMDNNVPQLGDKLQQIFQPSEQKYQQKCVEFEYQNQDSFQREYSNKNDEVFIKGSTISSTRLKFEEDAMEEDDDDDIINNNNNNINYNINDDTINNNNTINQNINIDKYKSSDSCFTVGNFNNDDHNENFQITNNDINYNNNFVRSNSNNIDQATSPINFQDSLNNQQNNVEKLVPYSTSTTLDSEEPGLVTEQEKNFDQINELQTDLQDKMHIEEDQENRLCYSVGAEKIRKENQFMEKNFDDEKFCKSVGFERKKFDLNSSVNSDDDMFSKNFAISDQKFQSKSDDENVGKSQQDIGGGRRVSFCVQNINQNFNKNKKLSSIKADADKDKPRWKF